VRVLLINQVIVLSDQRRVEYLKLNCDYKKKEEKLSKLIKLYATTTQTVSTPSSLFHYLDEFKYSGEKPSIVYVDFFQENHSGKRFGSGAVVYVTTEREKNILLSEFNQSRFNLEGNLLKIELPKIKNEF